MKFYIITYEDNAAPESIGYLFFTAKGSASRWVLRMKRAEKHYKKKFDKACKEQDTKFPLNEADLPMEVPLEKEYQLKEIEFKGSPKKLVWQALNYQVVSF